MSAEGKAKLEHCTKTLNVSKGEVVRRGIDRVYQDLLDSEKDEKGH